MARSGDSGAKRRDVSGLCRDKAFGLVRGPFWAQGCGFGILGSASWSFQVTSPSLRYVVYLIQLGTFLANPSAAEIRDQAVEQPSSISLVSAMTLGTYKVLSN